MQKAVTKVIIRKENPGAWPGLSGNQIGFGVFLKTIFKIAFPVAVIGAGEDLPCALAGAGHFRFTAALGAIASPRTGLGPYTST